jgi:hypothetical protein
LYAVTIEVLKHLHLVFMFDAFGYDFHLEAVPHSDDGFYKRIAAAGFAELLDERTVYFES